MFYAEGLKMERFGSDENTLIREELARVLTSQIFGGAERHKQILQYVVDRYLDGTAEDIRAKTIALDVYGNSVSEIERRETTVRVDAGRLRRRLDDYYTQEGAQNTVRIRLPKGGYAPSFEFLAGTAPNAEQGRGDHGKLDKTLPEPTPSLSSVSARKRQMFVVAALGVFFAISALQIYQWSSGPRDSPERSVSGQTRAAVFLASPRRLEAVNLAETGRDMIFPAIDPKRLQAALIVFEASIEADPNYFGGHAGAAQVLALSSLRNPEAELAVDYLELSEKRAKTAETLAPEEAWTQSARAAVEWAAGNFAEARSKSAFATSIAPEDLHILEFDALLNLFSGNFEHVITVITALRQSAQRQSGAVFDNALGSAYFHSGDPKKALDVFSKAIQSGAPFGPISIAYMAASYQQLGQLSPAKKHAKQLMEGWPYFRPVPLFQNLFLDGTHADYLVSALEAAGWEARHGPSN
jgi:tetratricopeptide (TPR) repeat protein